MKILYLYEGKMNGHGLDLVADYQLKSLSERGHQVDLVSRGRVTLPGLRCRKVIWNPAKLVSFMSSDIYYAANRRWLATVAKRMVEKNRYDVVVGWQRAALPLFHAARKKRIPCVLNCAGAVAFREPSLIRWPGWSDPELAEEYNLSELILAPSLRTREVFVSQGLPDIRVRSIERGFDPEHFYPAGEKPGKFRVLFCGRICERKGAVQLFDAWCRADLQDAELWYIGNVDGSLEAWARECRRPDVRFLGFRPDVGDLMRQCTVHAMLSSRESMGKTFIEAAACGLVNLATKDVGFPVVDEVNGLVVNRDSCEDIVMALKRLYQDVELCRRLGTTAREEVQASYTWEAFKARFSKAVEDAARSGNDTV